MLINFGDEVQELCEVVVRTTRQKYKQTRKTRYRVKELQLIIDVIVNMCDVQDDSCKKK